MQGRQNINIRSLISPKENVGRDHNRSISNKPF